MSSNIKSLLSNRNFMLLWCAYGISALGDHLSEMAILAHQDALRPDVDITPLQARMTFLFMLPFFVLGAASGAIADRLPRRWVMIFADLVRMAIMLAFLALIEGFGDQFGEWGPFLPLLLVGCLAAVFSPARAAMVPTLVPRDELVSANALIGGLGMIATMFAAAIGGEFAERGWIKAAFNVDACTFAASAVCVFLICAPAADRCHTPAGESLTPKEMGYPRTPREPFFGSIAAGVRYIASHRRVAQLIGIAVVFWFAGATVRSVIPAIVKHSYEGGFREMARFPMWIGIGLASGAVIVSILGNALRSEIAITWSLFGTGIGIACLAGTVIIDFDPAVAHVIGVCSVMVSGLFGAGISVSYNALIQRFVPNQYRGRVYGVFNVATVAGLLIATGVLAIPRWENLDQWAGYILLGIAALLFTVGGVTLSARLRSAYTDRAYAFVRGLIEVVAKFWYRCRRVGPCTIPRTGPVIVTANHGCHIDPLLIYACCTCRRISFIIAAEYCDIPIAKHIIHLARCIPVRRGQNDISATKATISRLRQGHAIGIFIQGGIRHGGHEDELKNGVALLALRTGAKVIPAHISGTRYDDSILKSILMRHDARIAFGPPVDLSEFKGRKGQALDAATGKIFEAIQSLAEVDNPPHNRQSTIDNRQSTEGGEKNS